MEDWELYPIELLNATPSEMRAHHAAVAEADRLYEQELQDFRDEKAPQVNVHYQCPACPQHVCGEFSEPPQCGWGHSPVPMRREAA